MNQRWTPCWWRVSCHIATTRLRLALCYCPIIIQLVTVDELDLSACCTCSTIIFPHATNQIIGVWRRPCRYRRPEKRAFLIPELNGYQTSYWGSNTTLKGYEAEISRVGFTSERVKKGSPCNDSLWRRPKDRNAGFVIFLRWKFDP